MSKKKVIPYTNGKVNWDLLSRCADQEGFSAMERLLLTNQEPDYKQLIEEVRDDPCLARLRLNDDTGVTLLHYAANDAQPEFGKLLIRLGADVNALEAMEGTPLHSAAKGGSVEFVQMLLEHGAAINVRDGRGVTPLYWAAVNHHDEAIKVLLDHGAEAEDDYTKNYVKGRREQGRAPKGGRA
jgi:ankyrin repeat protein